MTKTSSAAPQRISPEDITENQLFRLGYAQKIIAARNADRVMAEYFISAYIRIAELKRELAEKDELISRLQAQLEAESK
ncbi:hypothetical protein PENSUB_7656 [Penicillium subrubescens]|uniref:Uncharacterized protein n=2 Tax=Penicillium subrubescens TaxID=1316194 RepID=A0A1Q5TKH7_9EURO|nr:hypothetical protein PENSUB_7656 [Penicillium subrubescens]